MLARIRKAIIAGATAGVGAAFTVLAKSHWQLTSDTAGQAIGAFFAAAAVAGWATWRVPNARA